MSILFNLVYLAVVAGALPWLVWKSLQTGKYRQGFWIRLTGRVPVRQGDRPCIWLHAVSVGEVNLLAPLIDQLERDIQGCECVISSTTDTGLALACEKFAPRQVFRCPLDFSWAVGTTLRRIRPDVLVLAELELWPNLIRMAKSRGANIAIVNGRLSDRSYRGYRWIKSIVKRLLRHIDVVAVQNNQYGERFVNLGASSSSVHATGSLKIDGATTDRNNPVTKRLADLAHFSEDDIVLLAGSTQEPEEALALDAYQKVAAQYPQLRLVLVPRHPERFEAVATMLRRSGKRWQLRSELGQRKGHQANPRILLVDVIGELAAWWGTAQIAFVGGSMGSRGGQNMIEPAAFGAVVAFGPHTQNFRDVVAALLAARAAMVVHDGNELTQFVRRAIEDQDFAESYGRAAQQLVARQMGATARTVKLLAPLLGTSTQRHAHATSRVDAVGNTARKTTVRMPKTKVHSEKAEG